MRRVRSEPGRAGTWEIEDHPFRLVALGATWVLVPVGPRPRRRLAGSGLLARRFQTRTAALRALADMLADERANPAAGPDERFHVDGRPG